jgi:hypothetical protein
VQLDGESHLSGTETLAIAAAEDAAAEHLAAAERAKGKLLVSEPD